MSKERLVLSEKYKAFLKCDAPVEFLEGTTAAGKTTVGLFKFMCKVAESPKKLHILAADDTGTAEKNIINKDLGILDDFGILVEYLSPIHIYDRLFYRAHRLYYKRHGRSADVYCTACQKDYTRATQRCL